MKKRFFLMLICFGCTHRPHLSAVRVIPVNSKSIKFIGLDRSVMGEISRDSGIWQSLVPVYRMPADTDMKDYQPAQPGVYAVQDSAIVFTPDTPFVKNQTYFVRYFSFSQDNSAMDLIRGKKKLGQVPHIDLIFKQ